MSPIDHHTGDRIDWMDGLDGWTGLDWAALMNLLGPSCILIVPGRREYGVQKQKILFKGIERRDGTVCLDRCT
ncbi:hypothetical protein VFPPC_16081 [Pochonia chlamydosporia 170]|uniref:Uncharacterized protein n=1 Tax=Pochonia chlamydosporia 170 TaxID=1380566 RepID=A0A179FPD4_METCM|nr:hypothetical protein VFPPC_16081 [Pochonia chlamydosporia 170]OAQ66933.2 hypothetical protein VFPPC_16081 [Pochonia chlamydosporia 170]